MKKVFVLILALGSTLLSFGQTLIPVANEKGEWGYADSNGKIVVKCKYTQANPYVDGVAIVKDDDKYGFLDSNGKPKGEGIAYTAIDQYNGTDFFLVALGGKKASGKIKSRLTIVPRYFKGSTNDAVSGAKWGLLDKSGNIVLKPNYDEISSIRDGIAYVVKSGKWGFIDQYGKVILEPKKYAAMSDFTDKGLSLVKKNDYQVGVIDKTGRLVVEPKYPNVFLYYDDPSSTVDMHSMNTIYTSVPLKTAPYIEYGFYDTAGNFLIMCDMNGITVVPQGLMCQMNKPCDGMVVGTKWNKKVKNWVVYNMDTKTLYDVPSSEKISYGYYHNGYCLGQDDDKAFFINKKGQKCTEDYTKVFALKEGCHVVKKDGNLGMIDSTLQTILPLEYQNSGVEVSEGLLNVMKDGKWGFVDTKGHRVIPISYDLAFGFNKGHAFVGSIEKGDTIYGMINHSNSVEVPIKWKNIQYKVNENKQLDGVWVTKDSLYARYDLKNKDIKYAFTFKNLFFREDGSLIAQGNDGWGCVDFYGNMIVPFKLYNKDTVSKVIDIMKTNGKKNLTDGEAYRYNLIYSDICNKGNINDLLPDNLWDY